MTKHKYDTAEQYAVHPQEIDAILNNSLLITQDIIKRAKEKQYTQEIADEIREGIKQLNNFIVAKGKPNNADTIAFSPEEKIVLKELPRSLGNYIQLFITISELKFRNRKNDLRRIISVLYNEWTKMINDMETTNELV